MMMAPQRDTPPAARMLSLGAGVQSSTMAIMVAEGDLPPVDFAIFADTQAEPASVYDWLDELEAIVEASAHPFPIIRATRGNLEDASVVVKRSRKSGRTYLKALIPAFIDGLDGKPPGLLGRRCTEDYKLVPIFRETRKRLGVFGKRTPDEWWVEQWIGISTDEAHRMKPSRPKWLESRWPLIDARMSRADCLRYMADRGLHPPRSACVFCPFHSPEEWLRLKTEEPEGFDDAVAFERKLQAAAAKSETLKGVPYLTRNLQPLDSIDWEAEAQGDRWQLDLFGNECEGMCGI